MQKFLVLYMAPIEGLEEWMKSDPIVREAEENKMKKEWDEWMADHKQFFKGQTAGVGKTKRIIPTGVIDTKNNIMLYSIIEANSHEEAAELFKDHPHFGIPSGSIEVMPINFLPGMEK